MARSAQDCVVRALDRLSAENFKRFKMKLCETGEIMYGQIENESTVDVTQRMVSVFTEDRTLRETAEVLRAIGLNGDATKLETEAAKVSGAVSREVSSGDRREKGGTSSNTANGQHFVDRNMSELISRVTSVAPILDQLLQSGFINREMYMEIRNKKTSFEQMRILLHEGITPGGDRAKDELCKILWKEQKYLMEELKG